MTSLPLHPALVHLPLALAFVMPILAIGFAWASWTERIRPRSWIAIVALQAVLLAAGLVAMNTGEREEDRVERVVPEAALEQHEEYASQFVWATGVTLVLAALVFASPKRTIVRSLTVATVGGSGSRSMAEKRKASAHSVNDDTFDGESEVGSARAMR